MSRAIANCTVLAIRFATAGGMYGSTATDRPSVGMLATPAERYSMIEKNQLQSPGERR